MYCSNEFSYMYSGGPKLLYMLFFILCAVIIPYSVQEYTLQMGHVPLVANSITIQLVYYHLFESLGLILRSITMTS